MNNYIKTLVCLCVYVCVCARAHAHALADMLNYFTCFFRCTAYSKRMPFKFCNKWHVNINIVTGLKSEPSRTRYYHMCNLNIELYHLTCNINIAYYITTSSVT